jgi:hypothetical protein
MVEMRFNYRDLFRATRVAFSLQRIWIQFVGLVFGYAGYVIFTYLSLLSTGDKAFGDFWADYRLFPCVWNHQLAWYGWILFGIGIFLLVFFWLVSATGVARAAYMHLKGNTFYTWKEALRFAMKTKAGSLIATPLTILIIAVFTALGGAFIGLLGRIPFVGELGLSVLTLLWFLGALFLLFVILVLGVSLLLIPAILATTDDDAFEGIFQSFSTLYGQPWRFLIYSILIELYAIIGLVILAVFARHAWILLSKIFLWGMGEKFANLSFQATYFFKESLQPLIGTLETLPKCLPGSGFPESISLFRTTPEFVEGLSATMSVSSYILCLFMLMIGGLVLSYGLAVYNSGSTLLFLILKKKKDDENLLERKDREEEEEEPMEEPVEESKEEPSGEKAPEKKKTKKTKGGKKSSPKK